MDNIVARIRKILRDAEEADHCGAPNCCAEFARQTARETREQVDKIVLEVS